MFKRREPITQDDIVYNARHDPAIQMQRISKCVEVWNLLERYEQNFILTARALLKQEQELTLKQAEFLEQVYNQRTN